MFSFRLITKALEQAQQPTYEDLYQYISKNKTIPDFINKIDPEDPKLKALLLAIEEGNHQAEIFSDPDCYLYLLYSVKEKLIPFYQGMTIYSYLVALMQFTNKQALRSEDADVKFLHPLEIQKITENGALSKFGEAYLNATHKKFADYGVNLDFKKLKKFALSLAASEQWVLTLTTDHFDEKAEDPNHCDRIAFVLSVNTPYISKIEATSINAYWIPSITLINYLHAQMSPQSMLMQFSFGSITEETMYGVHRKEQHPVPLYAKSVKSNFRDADTWRCGPFLVWLHDVAHTFWANLLSREQRKIILDEYIPDLRQLREQALSFYDDMAAARLLKFIYIANAFDLSNPILFESAATRFSNYLFKTVARLEKPHPRSFYKIETPDSLSYSIGSLVEDRILYLMLCWLNRPEASEQNKKLWHNILFSDPSSSNGNIAFRRENSVVKALVSLADDKNQRAHVISGKDIAWEKWHETLALFEGGEEAYSDSKELWDTIIDDEELSKELPYIISDYNLKFFHPYLPMTTEKLKAFKELVTQKMNPAPEVLQATEESDEANYLGNWVTRLSRVMHV